MLHSAIKGINTEELMVYITSEWDRLNTTWDKKSILIVCQAHSIHAFSSHMRKLNLPRHQCQTAVALMESRSREELTRNVDSFIAVFGNSQLSNEMAKDVSKKFLTEEEGTEELLREAEA
jgi:hypothetical protein